MQFDIKDKSTVRKEVRIEVPAPQVDSAFATVYNQIAQKVSLPGFRKGKVPISHVRKVYADQALVDVTQRIIEKAWRKLLEDHADLIPLSEPDLDANPVVAGQPFSFTMSFDVAPKVELKSVAELSVERESWTASEEVVQYHLGQLAEQYPTFTVPADREVAAIGDKVTFDYSGSIDGEVFAGGTAQDQDLELGSGQFIPGFEEQIVGQKVGDDFNVEVPFPEDYHAENLAGKNAVFACTLKAISEKSVPEVGPALAEAVGEESIEALTANMKTNIEEDFNRRSDGVSRETLRKMVGGQYDFEVPASLLEASLEDRRNQLRSEAIQSGEATADANVDVDSKLEEARDDVVLDLRAHLVLDEYASREEINITDQEVFGEIRKIAQTTGPYAMQIMQMYQDPNRRAALARRMRHDKVLDFLLTQANVTTVDREVPAHDSEHEAQD